MASLFFVSLICILSFHPVITKVTEVIPFEAELENDTPNPYQTYIVHVILPDGFNASNFEDREKFYHSFLPKTTAALNDVSRMVYSYRTIITGFAARLSAGEVKEMEKKEGFVYARPEKMLNLQTTRSPKFLGLDPNNGFWLRSCLGKGSIIGVLDDGIKPDHQSFSDEGMPEVPPQWKGKCNLNGTKCNKKLIGARNFYELGQPVEVNNHGTHTSSTAAGNFVEGANFYGQANGTAAGTAPRAHLAFYQVCGERGCKDTDILAAMEAAIEDGVHVLSISIGGVSRSFYEDLLAVGAFHAIQRGVFVSCSAGNAGPGKASLSNETPWILTVGASTMDRSIRATAVLGNGKAFDGESLYQPKDFSPTLLPLVYPGLNGGKDAAECAKGSLNNTDVRGKVVLCDIGGSPVEMGQNVKDAGGTAVIAMNNEFSGCIINPELHVLPATEVSFAAGLEIKAYINSTSMPTATILFEGTVVGVKSAPMVAPFSSRGPNHASPGVLKPDIIGPGVLVLAAWASSVNGIRKTASTFDTASGTSMSCPHLSGVAALIKKVHPQWSPAAIKSAIMTTAYITNLNNTLITDHIMHPADVFAVGAGHVNPSRAAYPGLIYDIQPDDYIPYLCGLGYPDDKMHIIVQHPVRCSSVSSIPEAQLNYPSFAIELGSTTQTYTRTVTNVGRHRSTYNADISVIPGVDVNVQPPTLKFTK